MVAVREDLRLAREVGAPRIHNVEARVDPQRRGDLLQPQVLLDGDRIVGPPPDGGVVGGDGDDLAGDAAEAGDDAAAGDGLGGCAGG